MTVLSSSVSDESVLVFHPEQQHSNQLAAALASGGLLKKYICGTVQHSEIFNLIGPQKIDRFLSWLPIRRTITYSMPSALRLEAIHRLARYYDARVARRLSAIQPKAIVGYENCALYSFEEAKRLGIV